MAVTIKSQREIELMRESCKILADVFSQMEKAVHPGVSTLDINNLGEKLIRAHGCIPNFLNYNGYPASICVSVNDEVVHGIPHKDHILHEGDIVSLDAGLIYKGYHSDMTRTLVVGLANSWQQEIYTIVEEAQRKGLKAAEAGMTGRELDAIVRDSITACGYGDYYVHGTGHGVGLEIHEMPMINKRGATVLQTGMIFTIEPGIYIPGKGGVRIEDTVVLTEDGARALNGVKKQLIEIV